MIWCAFDSPDPRECFKYPHHGSVTNRTCYTDSQSCNSQLLSSSSLWPIQMIEISEKIFFSKIGFLTWKIIFFKIFLKHQKNIRNKNNQFLGCLKRIFSPICSMKADLGIIFQNFDANGLPNAYSRTAKYLTMMKNTIETKWGMPFFFYVTCAHDSMCVRFPWSWRMF